MTARQPSQPPVAVHAARAKALPLASSRTAAAFRAGTLPRRISPQRHEARTIGAACLQAAAGGASREEVAHWFGAASDRVGAEILSGKAPVSLGEAVLLPPFDVARRTVLEALRLRYERELASDDLPEPLRAQHADDVAVVRMLLARATAA